MLILACDKNDNIIHIKDAEKQKVYKCPECNGEVFAKKGEVNAHHFCHKTSDCGGNGESMVHRYYKEYISNLNEVEYDGQIMQVTHSEVEKRLTDGLVADVILILDNWKTIAVEICYKHPKDDEHIDKYKQLHLECYEVMVDMNDEQTDFEITSWKCLSGYECYNSEINELKQEINSLEQEIKVKDGEIHELQEQEKFLGKIIHNLEEEKKNERKERRAKASQEVEKTIREVTGFTYRELQSSFYNNKTGDKHYLLEMMMILEERISSDVKIVQFNWVRNGLDSRVFTMTFLDWKKNHVSDSMHNIRCSVYNFNLLARLVGEIYGVRVYKNENGKY